MDRNADHPDVTFGQTIKNDADMNITTLTTAPVVPLDDFNEFQAIWTKTDMFLVFIVCTTALDSSDNLPCSGADIEVLLYSR